MRHWPAIALVAMLASACGRLGYDSVEVRRAHGSATGGSGGDASVISAGGTTADAQGPNGGNGGPGGNNGGGGQTGPGGTDGSGGARSGGAGGAGTVDGGSGAGGTVDGGSGAGGAANSGGTGGASTGGPGGTGGSGGTYTCTPGATEVCDGRDNNCDARIDEGGVCPNRCTGQAWSGHGYMICDSTSSSFDPSEGLCEGQGMQLAKIDSQAENDFVTAALAPFNTRGAWIGGSATAVASEWRWMDGTQFWSGGAAPSGSATNGAYTNWKAGQPDGVAAGGRLGAPCVALSLEGTWVDEACNVFLPAACETP